jgi:hypothetical protein
MGNEEEQEFSTAEQRGRDGKEQSNVAENIVATDVARLATPMISTLRKDTGKDIAASELRQAHRSPRRWVFSFTSRLDEQHQGSH